MAMIAHWFERLSFRERLFCFLALLAFTGAFGFHYVSLLSSEARWYSKKIIYYQHAIKGLNQSLSSDERDARQAAFLSNINSSADILKIIRISLMDYDSLFLIDTNIGSRSIKNEAVSDNLNEYHIFLSVKGKKNQLLDFLTEFEKEYPKLSWEAVSYETADSSHFLNIEFKLYAVHGGDA